MLSPAIAAVGLWVVVSNGPATPESESSAPRFRKEILMIDVGDGGMMVNHLFFPSGAIEALNFTVPKGAEDIALEAGFAQEAPIQLDDTRYHAKVEPGAFPLVVRYRMDWFGRSYRLVQARDTDAPEANVFVSHMRPAPHVAKSNFEGMQEFTNGLYYNFALSGAVAGEPITVEFKGLRLSPFYFQATAALFSVSLLVLFFRPSHPTSKASAGRAKR